MLSCYRLLSQDTSSSASMEFRVVCSTQRPSIPGNFNALKASISSFFTFKPLVREFQRLSMQMDVSQSLNNSWVRLLDAFVDSAFKFVDIPLLPSQRNFGPIDELNEPVLANQIEGEVPADFTEGVYIRNGPNPLFGGLKSTTSMFGKTSHIWVEGEGMLHALYFQKSGDGRSWAVFYNNKYVESETFKLEKQRNKPSFIPAIEGDSPAILSAYLLNLLRFGKVNKYISNTNVFEHSGRLYSVAENHIPQEIDVFTLETLGNWTLNGGWNRPFTSHPKRAPTTGELVMMGVDAIKPFMELGVVSADGKRLVHKADVGLNRCTLCHEIGVTERFNVILDFPLTIDINRLLGGGPLIKFNKDHYARIGIMPRYGEAGSIRWFDVQSGCTFHILNSFEDSDEVVVLGCRTLDSVISGSDNTANKFEWFGTKRIESFEQNGDREDRLFPRCYEWRLNMETGEVKERYLTGTLFPMEFPMINGDFVGVRNKFGYTQIVDHEASSCSGMAKFGGLAKLYFEVPITESSTGDARQQNDKIKVEYHKFEDNTFCTGAVFVPKPGSLQEDDGWIITFVHNEDTNISKAYIIDTKRFTSEPIAKITLPCRVPYGFHGAFVPMSITKNFGL